MLHNLMQYGSTLRRYHHPNPPVPSSNHSGTSDASGSSFFAYRWAGFMGGQLWVARVASLEDLEAFHSHMDHAAPPRISVEVSVPQSTVEPNMHACF